MSALLPAALEYARRGWRVFPVHAICNDRCTCGRSDCSSPGKHPLVRRGVHSATTDKDVIREWWRKWRLANVAIATGSASGVIVVDVDVPEGERSLNALATAGYELPPTLTARTGSGGRHLCYRVPEHHLGNAVGGLPGIDGELPAIDLRAEGGYVLVPPSMHLSGSPYTWLDPDAGLAELPSWIRPRRRKRKTAPVTPAPRFDGAGTPYGLAALADEVTLLLHTPEGARNDQLNRSAFALGQLVAGGQLAEGAARSALEDAARRTGLEEPEISTTIDSGLSSGMLQPRGSGFDVAELHAGALPAPDNYSFCT